MGAYNKVYVLIHTLRGEQGASKETWSHLLRGFGKALGAKTEAHVLAYMDGQGELAKGLWCTMCAATVGKIMGGL